MTAAVPAVTTLRHEVERVEVARELQRAWLPVEIYPVSAGIKGGLAGSVVMAVLAMLYGILSHTSIWYPINLLAAGFFPARHDRNHGSNRRISSAGLPHRHSDSPDHVAARRPAIRRHAANASAAAHSAGRLHRAQSCGRVLIHSMLGIVNPVLNHRIDWLWFVHLAGGIRDRRGYRGFPPDAHTHLPAPAACRPRRHGRVPQQGRGPRQGQPMIRRAILPALYLLATTACGTRDFARGRPSADSMWIAPDKVMDFNFLYARNCSGCHGVDGKAGAAIALGDPVYLAIADDATMRRVTSNGVPGTSMPAFAQHSGGMLTDGQIDVIVGGMRSRWARPDALRNAQPPPYASQAPGDPKRGAAVFVVYCASCHGADGQGDKRASSIVNGSYLGAGERPGPAHHRHYRDGRNWALQIGAAMCPASRCRLRMSPMWWPGFPLSGHNSPASPIQRHCNRGHCNPRGGLQ